MQSPIGAVLAVIFCAAAAPAARAQSPADWPASVAQPAARALKPEPVSQGRKAVYFDHACAADWDTPGQSQHFIVLLPQAESNRWSSTCTARAATRTSR